MVSHRIAEPGDPGAGATKVLVLSHQELHEGARCYLLSHLTEHPGDLNNSQKDNMSSSV